MTPVDIINALTELKFNCAFNPYSNRCKVYDRKDAAKRRCDSLLAILEEAITREIDSLWIGRDLGYRGGRRTGLALTDDAHLHKHGERWGVAIEKPTKGEVVTERTASVIWGMLDRISAPVFLWNVFPLHPHNAREPFSNRTHNSQERRAGEEILHQLILLLEPRRLVPVGTVAASVAHHLRENQEVCQVRHPSYGGQNEFIAQISELYGVV